MHAVILAHENHGGSERFAEADAKDRWAMGGVLAVASSPGAALFPKAPSPYPPPRASAPKRGTAAATVPENRGEGKAAVGSGKGVGKVGKGAKECGKGSKRKGVARAWRARMVIGDGGHGKIRVVMRLSRWNPLLRLQR